MKIFTKKLVVIAIILISLFGNVYFFGNQFYQKQKTMFFDAGMEAGIIYVFEVAEAQGFVIFDGVTLIKQ